MKKRKEAEPTPPSAELVAATSRPSKIPAPQPAENTAAKAKASGEDTEGRNDGAEMAAVEQEGAAQGEASRPVEVDPTSPAPLRTAADPSLTSQGVNVVDASAVGVDADEEEDEDEDEDDHVIITTELPKHEQQPRHASQIVEQSARGQEHSQIQIQSQANGPQDPGFNQNQQNFGNMGFGDMNSFNPMMAMQSGMGISNFGMVPNMMGKHRNLSCIYTGLDAHIIPARDHPTLNLPSRSFPTFNQSRSWLNGWQGVPGMNMDPSMMFGGGFGGVGGMNDMMNMGMNMGGMNGFGGMSNIGMNGGGPGFFPGNGGYNHQNFGNQMNQLFHHNNRYGRNNYRGGFARGRGGGYGNYGRGRGGWQGYGQYTHGQNQNAMNRQYHQQYHQQQNYHGRDEGFDASVQQNVGRGSPSYEPVSGQDNSTINANLEPGTELANDTNKADGDDTNQTGESAAEVQTHGEDPVPGVRTVDDEGAEGKSSIRLSISLIRTETSCQDTTMGANDGQAAGEPAKVVVSPEGATTNGMPINSVHEDSVMHDNPHDQHYYDPQHQQGYEYGPRGRGGYRGARGAFNGRGDGGAYGYTATAFAPEPAPAPAPPANAPTGPKAMRAGLPNTGWYSRPAQPSAPAVLPQPEADPPKQPEHSERASSESRSGSRSQYDDRQENGKSPDNDDDFEGRRQDHEMRKDRERETPDADEVRDSVVNGDESNYKGRSRSESRDEEYSRRRHRDRDEDRYSSRSRRDRSRERRKHRHRSRSPARDTHLNGEGSEYSRRKSKSERGRERDYDDAHRGRNHESRRKHSRRDDDDEYESKDRSNHSLRHGRSSRDDGRVRDREREREREKARPVLEEPQDDIGFKIKGALKSSGQKPTLDTSMRPPQGPKPQRSDRRTSMQDSAPVTPNTLEKDEYAEDRMKAQNKRMETEAIRKQSLSKRHSRDEDEMDAPTGPRGNTDRVHSAKRSRTDGRRHSAKYEGEIKDAYDDHRRWR